MDQEIFTCTGSDINGLLHVFLIQRGQVEFVTQTEGKNMMAVTYQNLCIMIRDSVLT